jgi:hypothetical protein
MINVLTRVKNPEINKLILMSSQGVMIDIAHSPGAKGREESYNEYCQRK